MKKEINGILLRVFIGENEHFQGRPVYELVVLKAKQLGLAGATVSRGLMGFGADKVIHSTHILRLSENLPIVIEVMDTEDKIEKLIPYLEEVLTEGVATLEKVRIFKFK